MMRYKYGKQASSMDGTVCWVRLSWLSEPAAVLSAQARTSWLSEPAAVLSAQARTVHDLVQSSSFLPDGPNDLRVRRAMEFADGA
jgi:hypothetical protein